MYALDLQMNHIRQRTFGSPQDVVEYTNTRSTMQFSTPLIVPRPTTLPSSIESRNVRSLSDVRVTYTTTTTSRLLTITYDNNSWP